MRPDPIVVLGAARSGTSMVAGLFAQHGVWTGTCRQPDSYNAKGYFENLKLKPVLIERWGHLKRDLKLPNEQDGFRDDVETILAEDGYDGGPWLMKHGALYWPAWHEFDPTFVCVYRNPVDILSSGTRGNFIRGRRSVMLCHGAMEWCCQVEGGFRVDSERLIDGDYEQIEEAFHAAGIGFDPRIADRWIDDDLWHHRSAA